MRIRLWLTFGAVLLAGGLVYAWLKDTAPQPAPKASTQLEALDRVLARSEIQFDRPDWSGTEKSLKDSRALSDWRIVERDIREPKAPNLVLKLPSFDLPPFVEFVVWTVIGGLALFLVYGAIVALSGHGWPVTWSRDTEPTAPGGAAVTLNREQILADAESHAAAGRYEEAVHALLLHSISALRRQLGRNLAAALTSREIVATAELPAAGRTALQNLVARVELTYFGQRAAGLADYEACRALFESFTEAIATQR